MFYRNLLEVLCSLYRRVEDPSENVELLGSSKDLIERTVLLKFESLLLTSWMALGTLHHLCTIVFSCAAYGL